MQFQSPRFAGDPVLDEILNDPDTGTKKLQAGSNAGSVMRLQKALFDLKWTTRLEPPIHDEPTFVVGIYGPLTTETVLKYKTHYDIHFPPSAPTGFIDGFAGPRTFAKLDPQCVLWDEAHAAMIQKVADLNAAGIQVQIGSVSPSPILGTSGAIVAIIIQGQVGLMYYKRGVGAFEVHGNILDRHGQEGGATGRLGFPITDEFEEEPGFRMSAFENGLLRCDLSTGVVELIKLGEPVPPEVPVF